MASSHQSAYTAPATWPPPRAFPTFPTHARSYEEQGASPAYPPLPELESEQEDIDDEDTRGLREPALDSDSDEEEARDIDGRNDEDYDESVNDTPTPTPRNKGKRPECEYSLSGGPWTMVTRASKPLPTRVATPTPGQLERTQSIVSPLLTGPNDLLLPALERPAKRQKVDPARVPLHASLQGPVIRPRPTDAEVRERSQQLRQARDLQIVPETPATAIPPQVAIDATQANATIAETAWPVDDARTTFYNFTPPPVGGYLPVQGDSTAWQYHGMDPDQTKAWLGILSGSVIAFPYGHTYADRQRNTHLFARPPAPFDGLAKAFIADFLHVDVRTLHSSTPFMDGASGRPGQPPLGVLVYGLTAEQETHLLDARCLCAPEGAIIMTRNAFQFPSFMCNIAQLPAEPLSVIRDMIAEVLSGEGPRARMTTILRTLPGTEDASDRVLSQLVINNLSIELVDAHAVGGIPDPSFNIYLKPVSTNITVWNSLRELFRTTKYRKALVGEGFVTKISPCHGCHGVDHFSGMCRYPLTPRWSGPPARMSAPPNYARRGRPPPSSLLPYHRR